MQHWAAERETMLHAKIAGMKAGLALTGDQEKFWNPFASAVEDAFKSRMEGMQKMMKARESGQRMSPVDRMAFMADRMAEGAAKLKTISEAAKPLYDSFDDTQKSNFVLLGRGMLMSGPRSQSGMSVEWDYLGGDAGYTFEPYGWGGMME